MKERTKEIMINILITLIAMMVTFEVIVANTQVFVTEFKLSYYHWCISDYNESGFKTAPYEVMQEMYADRQSLYNSDDPIVWVAANVPTVVKAIFLALSVGVYLAVLTAWILVILRILNAKKAKKRKLQKI